MLADCWRCGTSVELTEEQQRLAQQLLDKANKSAAVAAPVAPVPAKPQPAKPLTAAIIEPPKPRSTVPVAAIAAPPVVAPIAPPPKPSSVPPPLPASHRKSNLPVAKLVSAPTRVVAPPLAPPVVAEKLSRLPWTMDAASRRRRWSRWLAALAALLLAGVALGLWLFVASLE